MTKTMLHQEWDMGVDEAIEAEAQAQAICMQTEDFDARLPRVRGEAEAGVRGRLMPDRVPRLAVLRATAHRALARELDAWRTHVATCRGRRDARRRAAARSCARSARAAGCAHARAATPLDVRSLCLVRETLAYHDGLADFAFAMQGLGSGPITLFGTDELKRALPARRRRAASDRRVRALRARRRLRRRGDATTARRDGGYVLDGDEDLDLQRRHRRLLRRVRARGARSGIIAFVVDADTPGLSVAERIDVIAPHPLATLRFDDCRVRASRSASRARA